MEAVPEVTTYNVIVSRLRPAWSKGGPRWRWKRCVKRKTQTEGFGSTLISECYDSILFSNSLMTFGDPRESPNDFPLKLIFDAPVCANKSYGFIQAFWCYVGYKPCFNQTCWVSTVRSCCCNGGMATNMKWRCNGATWFSPGTDDGWMMDTLKDFRSISSRKLPWNFWAVRLSGAGVPSSSLQPFRGVGCGPMSSVSVPLAPCCASYQI